MGGKMNPRIRLTSAKVEVGVKVEAELGKNVVTNLKQRIYSTEILDSCCQAQPQLQPKL